MHSPLEFSFVYRETIRALATQSNFHSYIQMATTIAPQIESMTLSRSRKRNREEFEAGFLEHGDTVSIVVPINPIKRMRLSGENKSASLTQTRSITATLSISKGMINKKRSFSDFCDDRTLKECSSLNKKIKTMDTHHIESSDRMDVDSQTEPTSFCKDRDTTNAMDIDEEVLMEANCKLSSRRRIKLKFPKNVSHLLCLNRYLQMFYFLIHREFVDRDWNFVLNAVLEPRHSELLL